jgi:DNA mismatch repair protein MutL
MQDIIQLLPDSLANQIAAGEVVQRPASIVKELLENSIDAQSTQIKLIIKDAGKALVQVIDNGIGMSETDARMCFERHATSKIKTTDDLFNIKTMGFRGEALASIAAVAQVELKSRRKLDNVGTQILMEGSKIKSQETISMNVGTSIAVKNIFFNVPARRNFLKGNPVEMRHILDEFQRVSLAYPEIEFSLWHNESEMYHLPAGKLSQRIMGIFGKNYQKNIAPCQEETPFLKIKGYIGKPESAKKTRGEQFFFVNKRFIKHNYLNHAVLTAFEGLIPRDTFPFYVLFLEINPNEIDVNIHPTKTEIKFIDEKTIYAMLQTSVKKALSVYHFIPAIDFDIDVNFTFDAKTNQVIKENVLQNRNINHQPHSNFSIQTPQREKNNQDNWQELYKILSEKTEEGTQTQWKLNQETGEMNIESKINQMNIHKSSLFEKEETNMPNRNVFQVLNQYLVAPVKSGLLIIHQKAAQERLLYDKFLQNVTQNKIVSQNLLFPSEWTISKVNLIIFQEIEEEIKKLGFIFQRKGNQITITGVPMDLGENNASEILEEMIEQYKNSTNIDANLQKNKVIQLLVKKIIARQKTTLSKEEMQMIIDKIFASKNPNYSPDGQKIMTLIEENHIHQFFMQ